MDPDFSHRPNCFGVVSRRRSLPSTTVAVLTDNLSYSLHSAHCSPGPYLAGNDFQSGERRLRLAEQAWNLNSRSADQYGHFVVRHCLGQSLGLVGLSYRDFFAAFRQIDKELLDAARVEGAGFWSQLLRIQIPLIKPTVLFMLIMTFVWSFLIFDYVYALTDGGPAGSSEVLSTLAYRYGFERFEFGKAAAISAFAGLLGMMAILFYIWLQKRGAEL